MKINRILALAVMLMLCVNSVHSQIVLLGSNDPNPMIGDGDFKDVWSSFRTGKQPPYWTMYNGDEITGSTKPTQMMGLDFGRMFGSNAHTTAISKPLDMNPLCTIPVIDSRIYWEFAADLEYKSKGTMSVSLLFGDHQRMLAERVPLIGGDLRNELFSGYYTVTEEDAQAGMPRVKVEFFSSDAIKVFLDYITISVENRDYVAPEIEGRIMGGGTIIEVKWSESKKMDGVTYKVYRAEIDEFNQRERAKFNFIGETSDMSYSDKDLVPGRNYTYVITRVDSERETSGSNRITMAISDSIPPSTPAGLKLVESDTEINVAWNRGDEVDLSHYSVERVNVATGQRRVICAKTPKTNFVDIDAVKGVNNRYEVFAYDYSGNRSETPAVAEGRVKMVEGASFSDLIKPMPLRGELRSDLWGAKGVLPRDANNGIEDGEWSYWGGRPVKDGDKYHILVARWAESSLRGHWEWSRSTVAHAVSDDPIGPYKVVDSLAYSYMNGLGHNPDIILMPDGSYALYSLIDWVPTIFTSTTMNGPWRLEGKMTIDREWASKRFETVANDKHTYQFERNLSGVVEDDGSILIVSKFGAMMRSTNGLVGPYRVITQKICYNETLPQNYRRFNYEDPVMWRDGVQYHMLINAFIAKRAIYLRSGDGVNWVYDPGVAYTPESTIYEDGTVNSWDKLERPHVLQDEYGRAVVLSLAVIDVDKGLDMGSDNHNSKNIMIPMHRHTLMAVVDKSAKVWNKEKVSRKESDKSSKSEEHIVVRIVSEDGFDATRDVDLSSLRYGSDRLVNYGDGAKVLESRVVDKDLEVSFDRSQCGIIDSDFALKLLGRRTNGELIIGYTKVQ